MVCAHACTLHNGPWRHTRVDNYWSRKSLTGIICSNKIHENLTFLSLLLPKNNKHYQSNALNIIGMHGSIDIGSQIHLVQSRAAESGFGVRWKRPFLAPSKVGPADNLYNKWERLTLRCGVTWIWSVKGYFVNRQLIILPGKTKTHAT
jgi:hypothetical protein